MPNRLRLLSFNIQNRRGEPAAVLQERMTQCAAFISSFTPDLVCLQEVVPEAWELLNTHLAPAASVYSPRIDGARHGEGAPLLLLNPAWTVRSQQSFWFSETPEHPSRDWKAVHPRVCSVLELTDPLDPNQTASLWIYNLHLDHRSGFARSQSLKLLRHRIREHSRPGDRILVCGDFNMPGYRKVVRDFLKPFPPLQDATLHHPIGMARPTYLGWGPFRLAKARIDLCLHSPSLHCPQYHAHTPDWKNNRISDHRAVEVKLSPASTS